MRFSNKDILEFYFSPPDIRGVRRLPQARREAVEQLFSEKETYRPMVGMERGWLYGYLNAGDLSVFVAIARDSSESRFFQEFRFDNKIFQIGESLCEARTEGEKVQVKEKGLQAEWRGKPPEQDVTVRIEEGTARAEFKYKFGPVSESAGPFRAVGDVFGRTVSYFFFTPAKASLAAKIEGDCEKLGISKGLGERIANREITSLFAYNESVRINNPLISEGWHWHMLGCYSDNPAKIEKIVGYMDLYLEEERIRPVKVMFNQQFYSIDLESGAMEMHTESETSVTQKEGKPVFSIKDDEGTMEAQVSPQIEPALRRMLGKKDLFGIHLQNIEYTAFPSAGTVKIRDKAYNAVGTSEIAGGKGQRWI
jgi:hypothetical protein